jgi:hypothetical protein
MDFNTLPVAKLLGFAKKEQLVAFSNNVPDLYTKLKTYYLSKMDLIKTELRKMMMGFNISSFMQQFEQNKNQEKVEIARQAQQAAEVLMEQELERRINERMNHPQPTQVIRATPPPIEISDVESVEFFPLHDQYEIQRLKIMELQRTLQSKNETIERLNRRLAYVEEKYRMLQLKFYRIKRD